MTVSVETIVDVDATLTEAETLAARVVENLCERGIILPAPQTHESLGIVTQYASGPNVNHAVDVFSDGFPCGMDVVIGRQVYDSGELGFELFCPNCNHQFKSDAIDWSAPLVQWFETGEVRRLTCPDCSDSTSFTKWFQPEFDLET